MASSFPPVETSAIAPPVSIKPYFTVSDWGAALPLMQSFMQTSPLGLHDWTRMDEELSWRSTYNDIDAMLESLDLLDPMLGAMISGPAELNRFEIHGPSGDMERIRAAIGDKSYDVELFDSGMGFQTGFINRTGTAQQETLRLRHDTMCSSHPHFTVHDWAAVKPLMDEFIEKTSAEPGCAYFGWTHSGNKLHWHGDYVNGEALKAHYHKVRPLLDAMAAGSISTLDRFEVHGPSAELEKATPVLDGLAGPALLEYQSDSRVKRLVDYWESPMLLA